MHRKTYINKYLKINVFTNSARILSLVNNFLDFGNTPCLEPTITIEFHLHEEPSKKSSHPKKSFYRHWFDENKNLTSFFGCIAATTAINPRTGIVKAAIAGYQESSKEGLLDFIFVKPMHFILAHHGLFFIHASVVCRGNDCVIISGPQNSGKSTIALTLTQDGFNFLADDDCFVKLWKNGIRLFPFPTKMGLHDTIIKKYPKVNEHLLKNYRYGMKRRFSFSSMHAPHDGVKTFQCKTILFPRYQAKNKICIRRMSKEKTLTRLAAESSFLNSFYLAEEIKKIQNENFWALYNLTRNAESFELLYNDKSLDKIPEIIDKVF